MFAHFEIRQKNLSKARKILGTALGKCPKGRLYKAYIEMETELREFDRVRKLYNKYIMFNPENCRTWIDFAELETMLGDVDRARAIYALGVKRDKLDMPEVLWKSYIDFEVSCEEWEKARILYKRLLKKTNHIKVWSALCQFEFTAHPKKKRYQRTTDTYKLAAEAMRLQYKQCKNDKNTIKLKEEATDEDIVEAETVFKQSIENRITILESWQAFEDQHGKDGPNSEANKELKLHLPKKVKKRRKINITAIAGDSNNVMQPTEETTTWEEFWDYIFPEEEEQTSSFKLLMMAKAWKENKSKSEQYDPTEALNEVNPDKIMEVQRNVREEGKVSWAQQLEDENDQGPEKVPEYVPGGSVQQGEIDISDDDE